MRLILIVVLAGFLVLTGAALYHQGFVDIFASQFTTFGGAQVLIDLIIALSFFIVWMWKDAKANGRNPLPWTIFILITGSIAALVYLILYKVKNKN
jgi:hypothetical protein